MLVILAAAVALGACAVNIEDHSPPAAPPIDAAALVHARQGGMAMSVTALGAVSSGYERRAPARSYRMPAAGLADFARSLPALFDARTAGITGTGAAPALWSDPQGFSARAGEYQAATGALVAAIEADDQPAIAAALASTKAACKACHDSYRAQ